MSKKKPKKRYALTPQSVGRAWFDLVDYDYLDKLSEDVLDFLEKFSQEFYRNSLKKGGTNLHPDTKRCYDSKNARSRDLWNTNYRIDFGINPDVLDAWAEIAFSCGFV